MLLDNPNELKLIHHTKQISPDAKPDYSPVGFSEVGRVVLI